MVRWGCTLPAPPFGKTTLGKEGALTWNEQSRLAGAELLPQPTPAPSRSPPGDTCRLAQAGNEAMREKEEDAGKGGKDN